VTSLTGSTTPAPSFNVRRARPDDATAVEALLDAAAKWQRSRGIEQWTPGQFADEIRETTATGELHVAVRGDDLIGCFLLDVGSPGWLEPWLVERGRDPNDAGYLGRLTVARDVTGRGIGVQLVEIASERTAALGLAYLRLDCPAENARLRRYYLDANFTHIGDVHTRGPSGQRWVSSVFERATTDAQP
jgi:ribosomal protein S18 acetylase RimI-like enzyme